MAVVLCIVFFRQGSGVLPVDVEQFQTGLSVVIVAFRIVILSGNLQPFATISNCVTNGNKLMH